MSEDGVRTEKCKKYQVTALGTAAWGVAWQPRAMLQLAFCSGSLLTFFLFFAVSFKAVFFCRRRSSTARTVSLRIHDQDLEHLEGLARRGSDP